MSKPKLGAGNVDIDLDGENVILRPTLKAAQAISRLHGGLVGAVERTMKFDVDTIVSVVALGIGREQKDIADQVWKSGVSVLAPDVVKFLTMLANGGRPDDGGEGEENPQTNG